MSQWGCVWVLVLTALAGAARATDPPPEPASPAEAIAAGAPILNLRPRLELVDQQGRPENAEALSLRTLIGWRTAVWKGWSGTFEAINVGKPGADYHDGQNGRVREPVVADPDDTDVNQIYLDWTGLPGTRVRAGRQSIKLDNVRFVGNVEFRQVMQVFDGVTMENASLPRTRLYAAWLGRLKTVNTRRHDTDTVLLNAHYALSPTEALIAYGYLQDQDDAFSRTAFGGPAADDTSNRILGLRADGAHAISQDWKLLYTAEYAKQDDYAGGDGRIDAHYLRLGLGGQWRGWWLRYDYEVLSSNDGRYGFQTPLGTNHLFQGWADQFLTTPRFGIRDGILSGGAKFGKVQVLFEYHSLDSEFGDVDFGDEFDLGVSMQLMPKLLGKIEYADYRDGDAGSPPDTRKIWFTLLYNY